MSTIGYKRTLFEVSKSAKNHRKWTIFQHFRIQMTRNGSKKQALKKSSEIFRKSAFVEDVQSVFHPLISKSVIGMCKLDRIPKLAEQTRDSATSAIGVQMVPNFPGWEEFHRMVFGIHPMYPLASAACAASADTCNPPSRR